MGEYNERAEEDARETVSYFIDEIVQEIIERENAGTAELQINDLSDSYHHENHVDKSYSLKKAAELLDDLSDYEETDSGLWEGQEPRDAISTMAAFTYGNAVLRKFNDLVEDIYNAINDAVSAESLVWEHGDEPNGLTYEEHDAWVVMEKNWQAKLEKQVKEIVLVAAGIKKAPRIPPGKKEWRPPEE
jgi:hypothetical protein